MADITDPRAPTRKELARFLPDQRSIRAFEKLFELVPSEFNVNQQLIEEVLIYAGTADAKANQANDGVSTLTDLIASLRQKVVSIAVDYPALVGNYSIIADATAAPITVTLPLASKAKSFIIGTTKEDASTNSVIVARSGVDLIVGETTQTLLYAGEVFNFISDGSNWQLAN